MNANLKLKSKNVRPFPHNTDANFDDTDTNYLTHFLNNEKNNFLPSIQNSIEFNHYLVNELCKNNVTCVFCVLTVIITIDC